MSFQGLYWLALIKICRLLIAVKLTSAAEWIGEHSGLKSRLKSLIDSD